jgi:flagellar hook-length control protein FliK
VLQFDTAPPAATLPASQRIPVSASSEGTPGTAGAFGNLLALLTGHHAGGGKTQTAPGNSRGPQNADATMPMAFGRAATASKAGGTAKKAGGTAKKAGETAKDGRTIPDAAAAASETDAHAADEKALADNLTWLLALAAAPKTAAQIPAPANGPGGPAAESPMTDASATPAAAFESPPAGSEAGCTLVAADRAAFLRAHARGAQHTAAATSPTDAAGASVDNTPATAAVIAATPDAAADAADSGPAPEAGTPQLAPRVFAADAAPAIDALKKSGTPPVPAAVFVPIPAGESRPGNDGSATKRDGRSSDERFVETSLPKPGALAPAMSPVFQLPVEVNAQSGHQLLAIEAAAPARADVPADGDLPRQIVQAIRMQWADGVGTARITLQPEYLGELSIAIRVEHGAVTASLESNTASVREWIDGNQPMLRQALAEHGLHLEKLTVAEEQPQPDWSGNEDPKQKHQEEEARRAQRARRRNDADAPAFEMVV